MKNIEIKEFIPYLSTVLLVALMTLSAEVLHEKEIIFPEITALAVGYMVAKKRSWKVNGKRMLALITGCAIMGVCIVRFVPFSTYIEVILAFTIAQVLFMFSGTTIDLSWHLRYLWHLLSFPDHETRQEIYRSSIHRLCIKSLR